MAVFAKETFRKKMKVISGELKLNNLNHTKTKYIIKRTKFIKVKK